jgi:hypothetical protein
MQGGRGGESQRPRLRRVAEALNAEGPWKIVLSPISFDRKGDVPVPGYVFCIWKNGTYGFTHGTQPSSSRSARYEDSCRLGWKMICSGCGSTHRL